VQPNTLIDAAVFNAFTADVATALSTAMYKDGQQTSIANQAMGGFKFTGLGAGVNANDSVRLSQVQSGEMFLLGTVAGTNTVTASANPPISAYSTGMVFVLTPASSNSGATTLNINSVGAKNIFNGGVACVGGELVSGVPVMVEYDGTQFNIIGSTRRFTNGGLSISGAPGSGTFEGGGVTANIWENISTAALSNTIPEVGQQVYMTSDTGLANAGSAYKIGHTVKLLATAASANVYGNNTIVDAYAGAGGYLVTGMEVDINQRGAAATGLGTPTAAYGYQSVAGAGTSTAGYWATTAFAGSWNYGFAADGTLNLAAFYDQSDTTPASFKGVNTHTYGVDLLGGTYSYGLAAANAVAILGQKDSGGTVRQILALNSADTLDIGYASANALKIIAQIRNNNGASPVAALGFNVSAAAEASVSKAGIGILRNNTQGVGDMVFYNRNNTDTAAFTATDELLRIAATGAITSHGLLATPAGGTANSGINFGSAGVGIIWGSGAPSATMPAGSIYLRTDGGASTRIYSTSGGGTWFAVTSA